MVYSELFNGPDVDLSWDDTVELYKSMVLADQRSGVVGVRKRSVSTSVAPTGDRSIRPRADFLPPEMRRAIYLRSEVVRACVTTPIELITSLNWTIKPIDSKRTRWMKKKKPKAYLDQQRRIKWAEKLFRRPNRAEDLETFHRRLLLDLMLDDDAYYEIVYAELPNGDRLPVELGVIPSSTVELDCDDQGIVEGYQQSYNAVEQTYFDFDEVARMTMHPSSWSVYGTPIIDTAIVSIMNDLNSMKWNAAYFERDGIPPGLLAIMGVSKEEYKRLQAGFKQTSQDNPHNIHTVRTDGVGADGKPLNKIFDFVPLQQLSQKDMQFAELLKAVAGRICMLFNLTPGEIGMTEQQTGGIGNGVAETQAALAQSKGVAPLMRKTAQTHTHHVLHEGLGWTDLEFAYTLANTPQEDQAFQKSLQLLENGSKTINEMRNDQGMEPVDWGDLPLRAPQGWQPPMSGQQMAQQMMQQQMGGAPPGQQPGGPPPGQQPGGPPQQALQKSAEPKRIIITLRP